MNLWAGTFAINSCPNYICKERAPPTEYSALFLKSFPLPWSVFLVAAVDSS